MYVDMSETKGEYEGGLFPSRIKQENLSQWKYESVELVPGVLTFPENADDCMHAQSLQEVARYVWHWYLGRKTFVSVVGPIWPVSMSSQGPRQTATYLRTLPSPLESGTHTGPI
jgi:hypothetical protein